MAAILQGLPEFKADGSWSLATDEFSRGRLSTGTCENISRRVATNESNVANHSIVATATTNRLLIVRGQKSTAKFN